jgi:hypothetical protein
VSGKKKQAGRGRSTDRRTREQQALRAARQRPAGAAAAGRDGGRPAGEQADAAGSAVLEQRYYLDVSAVRIQEWLARTPVLKQWRGASAMLSEATAWERWKGSLPPGTEWNEEAGDLAGVVSLRAVSRQEQEARDALTAAARAVAAELRRALPHCPIRGYTGVGPSYAVAYQQIDHARRTGQVVVDAPPAPAEVILAMPCETCRQAAAVRQIRDDDGQQRRVCGECADRWSAGGRTTAGGEAAPRAETVLQDALAGISGNRPRFPDNSKELAEAAVNRSGGASTQVALVYADGNRVGAFLAAAASVALTQGRPHKEEIVTAIGRAVVEAVAVTVRDLFGERTVLPILPHVADGDDLMVSVAAADAWPFVRHLLREFTSQLQVLTAGWPAAATAALPSMSAGMVFHHHTYPFSDAVRMAKAQLRSAKEKAEGRASTVDFLDLTADGDHSHGQRALTLLDLDSRAVLLGQVAGLPRAQRATLVGLCREAAEHDAGGAAAGAGRPAGPFPETAEEALARRLVELGAVPLWQVIGLGSPVSVERARERLVGPQRQAERSTLRLTLDLARWWPAPDPAADPAAGADSREAVRR